MEMVERPAAARLVFSQSSLQDFVDCPRRFELRYLLRVRWPAVESEPLQEVERAMQRGRLFHRLVQQFWLGVPPARLAPFVKDDGLAVWWDNFLRFAQGNALPPQARRHPEVRLSAPLGGQRLVAALDLLVVAPDGYLTIFDWKTSAKRPKSAWLKDRWQTRVYPYLLAQAGTRLFDGRPPCPQQIEMVYWFAAHPDQPERLAYSPECMQRDEAALLGLVDQVLYFISQAEQHRQGVFTQTEHAQRCAYCEYRSLCDRGEPGNFADFEDEPDDTPLTAEGFNFEQITEVSY